MDDMDASPNHKKRYLVRSSSDPSVNTTDRIPGIPPYPDPPRYHRSPKVGNCDWFMSFLPPLSKQFQVNKKC